VRPKRTLPWYKMFDFFARLFSVSSHSSDPMSEPHPDPFDSLLLPDLCTNTDAFLSIYRDGVSRSPDPFAALTRFRVGPMTGNKDPKTYQHELLSLKVEDTHTHFVHDFFIERNGAMLQVLPQSTTGASAPMVSTAAVGSTAAVSVSTAAVSASSIVASECVTQICTTSQSSEVYTLLPLNETPTSAPSTPSSSTYDLSSMPTFPSQSNTPKRSLHERFTLTAIQALHSSSPKSLSCAAEDRILGRGKFVTNGQMVEGVWEAGKAIREIGQVVDQLHPQDLSLLELGMIVHEIHLEAPNYHVLANQCYWFIRTICIIIILLYGDQLNLVKPSHKSPNQYLPNLSGRWKNMLIAAPDDEAIRRIIIKFTRRQEQFFSEVSFREF
jgi:hypothetical protein